jgi:hypothetical protein
MQAREGLDGAPLGFQPKAAFPLPMMSKTSASRRW